MYKYYKILLFYTTYGLGEPLFPSNLAQEVLIDLKCSL